MYTYQLVDPLTIVITYCSGWECTATSWLWAQAPPFRLFTFVFHRNSARFHLSSFLTFYLFFKIGILIIITVKEKNKIIGNINHAFCNTYFSLFAISINFSKKKLYIKEIKHKIKLIIRKIKFTLKTKETLKFFHI